MAVLTFAQFSEFAQELRRQAEQCGIACTDFEFDESGDAVQLLFSVKAPLMVQRAHLHEGDGTLPEIAAAVLAVHKEDTHLGVDG